MEVAFPYKLPVYGLKVAAYSFNLEPANYICANSVMQHTCYAFFFTSQDYNITDNGQKCWNKMIYDALPQMAGSGMI
jgi:hypothetical protein